MRMIFPACAAAVAVMAGTSLICLSMARQSTNTVETMPVVPLASVNAPPVLPWDRAHRAELLSLKSHADVLAISGRYQSACNGYQLILDLAADHEVTDPVAVAVVTGARESRDRGLQILRSVETPAITSSVIAQVVPVRLGPEKPPVVPAPVIMALGTQPTTSPSEPAKVTTIEASPPSLFADAVTKPVQPSYANKPAADSQGSLTQSDLDGGSNLPDLFSQSGAGQNYATAPRSVPPTVRLTSGSGGSGQGFWEAWITGNANISATVTEGGHTYKLGGPGGPRSISGTGTGPVIGHINP